MITLPTILCVLSLSIGDVAQEATPEETVRRLSSAADTELAASIRDLNALRETIATEKLPLAQELTGLEERLTSLRRDHDKVTRLVDAGALEIATIKAEMKARQDELTYVGNLLDEYARTFESKVNVTELQYCGEAIESAKQATENTALSMAEKFDRQVAFANLSVKRLFDAIGGMRFPGTAVDVQGAVSNGMFALIGPVALFCAESGSPSGVAIAQSGSTKPLVRALEGPIQLGIAALVDSGDGVLPLDPSRGGALKALVQKTNIVHIFEKGGPIMWPLLLASVLALGTVIERLFFLANERRKRDPKALEALLSEVEKGHIDAAIAIAAKSKFYVVRTLGYALKHQHESLANALLFAQAQELKRFRRGIPILDTVITLAPLLGLLGTVTGMMSSFSLIGGELSAPGAITGGIAEALIATAFGLGIAITALLPFNFLNTKLDEARHEIESAATQLELLVHPPGAAPLSGSHAASHMASHTERGATADARDHAELVPVRREPLRHERDLRKKREAIEREMMELKIRLGEIEMQHIEDQERELRGQLVRGQPAKE